MIIKVLLILATIAFFAFSVFADKKEAEAEQRDAYSLSHFYNALSFKLGFFGAVCLVAFFAMILVEIV
jgi:hypothetical protein